MTTLKWLTVGVGLYGVTVISLINTFLLLSEPPPGLALRIVSCD